MRFWPRSLAGRLIALLLAALFISHMISLAVLQDERRLALRAMARDDAVDRIAAVARLLSQTPMTLHGEVLAAASTPRLRFRLSDSPSVAEPAAPDALVRRVRMELAARIGAPEQDVRLTILEEEEWWLYERRRQWWAERRDQGRNDGRAEAGANRRGGDRENVGPEQRRTASRVTLGPGLLVSIRLPDDDAWLEAASRLGHVDRRWGGPAVVSLAVSSTAVVLIVFFLMRRAMRPIHRLTQAADALGRGESNRQVVEEGAEDVRALIRAFNDMRDRLDRHLNDRMQMLAAMSHDLRTPLTSLRLRAELLDDSEARARILKTLEELQQMAEEALSFIREEARQEETHRTDLTALVENLCNDAEDAGHSVRSSAVERVILRCRPMGLRRALRNLIDNAVRHSDGDVAVSVSDSDRCVTVLIDDNGPGIAIGDLERVFEPFVRGEPSRNRHTGGVGLGLAVARSIIRAHGGDIVLENRSGGGLTARVTLPSR